MKLKDTIYHHKSSTPNLTAMGDDSTNAVNL